MCFCKMFNRWISGIPIQKQSSTDDVAKEESINSNTDNCHTLSHH